MKKILILLVLVLMTIPAYGADADTVYRINIENQIFNKLGGASSMWPASAVHFEIELNLREYATFVGIPKEDTILSVNGQTDYALNSDFISIRGVLKLSGGRKKMLRRKGADETSPVMKGIGEEQITVNQIQYYAIKPLKGSSVIIFDPPENDAGTDTIIITYNAYAAKLTGDSTITDVPYGGIPVIIWGSTLNLMIRNRENTFVQLMLPTVAAKYGQVAGSLTSQEKSSFNYDPATKPQ